MYQSISASMMKVKRRITILDTTLRDGDQSPGMAFSMKEKIEIALMLERLGVDIIEAGFPASSRGEFEMVREIVSRIKRSAISVMARSVPEDIVMAAEALKGAERKHIHLTISTSKLHRRYKLKKSGEEIIRMAVSSVKLAGSFADSVEIGAEDATRTEYKFLAEFCAAVTEAGANTVNIPDTVGYCHPFEFSKLIKRLLNHIPAFSSGSSLISVHCHNDLGMATANTLSGILAGASQAETTLLGIGERAGNAALEEVVTAIRSREEYYPVCTAINSGLFSEAARIISRINAIRPHPCKPVVGSNAYLHGSGIHQQGMIRNEDTYSIIKQENLSSSRFVLSRHSGINGMTEKIKEVAGIDLPGNAVSVLYPEFKKEADKKKYLSSTDLLLILYKKDFIKNTIWSLKKIYYFNEKSWDKEEFSVFLGFVNQDGVEKWINSNGTTKWNAMTGALRSAFNFEIRIMDFSSSFFADEYAMAERSRLEAEFEGIVYADESFGNDSLTLFAESYLNIVNQIIVRYQFGSG